MNLNSDRYARQMPIIGVDGQNKMANAKILIVGVGGLGSPIALYLSAAGIGTIGLIDNDKVSTSNLQRQVLYEESQVGKNKVDCAKQRILAINSNVIVNTINSQLDETNAEDIIKNYDIVVDGCDNLETRYLIDNICRELQKPYVYGAINATDGQVAVFNYKSKICYAQIFPKPIDNNKTQSSPPVLGLTPAIIGSAQAMEVIKILTGIGEVLDGKLWTYNLLTNESSCYNFASFF